MKTFKIYIACLLFMMTFNENAQAQRDTLIYIGDPMCSWCYGFSPELDIVLAAFPEAPFEMVMGGLRPDGRESLSELEDFLKEHWMEVSRASGQKFNFSIFEKEDWFYNTEPACRAVLIVKDLKREAMYSYFKAVQKAFYLDNVNPLDEDTYISIAAHFGIDEKKFQSMFRSPSAKQTSYNDFELAQAMGVKGFPTLIAK